MDHEGAEPRGAGGPWAGSDPIGNAGDSDGKKNAVARAHSSLAGARVEEPIQPQNRLEWSAANLARNSLRSENIKTFETVSLRARRL